MGRPKGSKNKPKEEVIKTIATVAEVKVEAKEETPKKERKPRITKASKQKEDDKPVYVDEDAAERRRILDENTLDPFIPITIEKFECQFVELTQWMGIIPETGSETRGGRYSGSHYPVKGCNQNVWPVLAYITTDLDKYRQAGYDDKTIYAGCINYLSGITAGKKKKYGNLMPYTFSIKDERIVATFVTDDRKNKHFWSEGVIR